MLSRTGFSLRGFILARPKIRRQTTENLLCHSERSEESLFDLSIGKKPREILRFAQNDSAFEFFRNLFTLSYYLLLGSLFYFQA